jgi:hypothetical protein
MPLLRMVHFMLMLPPGLCLRSWTQKLALSCVLSVKTTKRYHGTSDEPRTARSFDSVDTFAGTIRITT